MAYIGVDPNIGDITFQTFTGDGSAVSFTLGQSVVSGEALLVTIGNVVQEPGASKAYTAQGNTLTFSAAPANGDVITVRFFGRAVDQPTSYAMQLFKYVATNNQTAFTGADANGAILAFSGDDVDVYLNGVHLDSSDFTASNGDTITLGTGVAASDELVIRAYRAFTVTDTVSKASGGTFAGAVTVPQLNADNLRLDGNTISSTDADGNLTLDPNGTGDVIVTSAETSSTATLTVQNTNASGQGAVLRVKAANTNANSKMVFDDGGTESGFVFDGGANAVQHFVNGSERLRVDSSGNVGIGNASPDSPLHVIGDGKFKSSGEVKIRFQNDTTGTGSSDGSFVGLFNGSDGMALYNYEATPMRFFTSNAERMRIESAGNIKISDKFRFTAGGDFEAPATGFSQGTNSKQFAAAIIYSSRSSTSSSAHLAFYNSNGEVGTITTQGSSTAYNTSSDHRLKENVADMTGAIARVNALAPKRFNFIADPDTTVDGFLAHEAQAVVPEAITGTHNEVDENGNAVMQGIDQSKLVPLLVGALKESIAKIETLETKVAALEAGE